MKKIIGKMYSIDVEQKLISLIRFIPTAPVTFQVGDVVEVQVSFAVLPLRYGKLKSSLILRSITLLDGSVSQVCRFVLIAEYSLNEDNRQQLFSNYPQQSLRLQTSLVLL